MYNKIVWVCEHCGSPDVEYKQWVKLNEDSIQWNLDDIEDSKDDTWCCKCEDHNGICAEEDYIRWKNEENGDNI